MCYNRAASSIKTDKAKNVMKRRILVVNDTDEFLRQYQIILSTAGYEVITETYTCLDPAVIEGFNVDVIILDFIISNKTNALNILSFLKKQPATAIIPIILCTIRQQDIILKQEYFQHQNISVLFKPFELHHLLLTIRQSLYTS
jgi:DNA-binding response OmpR family regulator